MGRDRASFARARGGRSSRGRLEPGPGVAQRKRAHARKINQRCQSFATAALRVIGPS